MRSYENTLNTILQLNKKHKCFSFSTEVDNELKAMPYIDILVLSNEGLITLHDKTKEYYPPAYSFKINPSAFCYFEKKHDEKVDYYKKLAISKTSDVIVSIIVSLITSLITWLLLA